MKYQVKKVLSVFLAASMMITACPLVEYAEEENQAAVQQTEKTEMAAEQAAEQTPAENNATVPEMPQTSQENSSSTPEISVNKEVQNTEKKEENIPAAEGKTESVQDQTDVQVSAVSDSEKTEAADSNDNIRTETGKSLEGDNLEGETKENDSQQSESQEDESQEGESQEGESQEGESQEGESQEGESQEGAGQEGESQKGAGQEGEKQEGEKQEGENQEGEKQEGEKQEGEKQEGENQEGENQEGENQETSLSEWTVAWSLDGQAIDGSYISWDGKEKEVTATATKGDDQITLVVTTNPASVKDPGKYTASASVSQKDMETYHFKDAGSAETTFSIVKTINIEWKDPENGYIYNGKNQLPEASAEGDDSIEVTVSLEGASAEAVNTGDYTAKASVADEYYQVSEDNSTHTFTIKPLDVTIKAEAGQNKTYATKDPESYKFVVASVSGDLMDAQTVQGELDVKILSRQEGEDAGKYNYNLTGAEGSSLQTGNYTVTLENTEEAVFEILPLDITITPDKDQEKFYGEKDPEEFTYQLSWAEGLELTKSEDEIRKELLAGVKAEGEEDANKNILKREEGEDVNRSEDGKNAENKEYLFSLLQETYQNYKITLVSENKFTIKPLTVTVNKSKITSREKGFSVETKDLEGKQLDSGAVRKVVITAVFPDDHQGIGFEEDLKKFIDEEKLIFNEKENSLDIEIEDYDYWLISDKSKTWTGKLPAGTKLTVAIHGGNGIVSSDTAEVTVGKQKVEAVWSSDADSDPATNYLSKGNKLYVSAGKNTKTGELVVIVYNGRDNVIKALNTMVEPESRGTAGSPDAKQTVIARFVDVLNLEFEKAVYGFTYDDQAFSIPAANILFSNRDKKIVIRLPEEGTITKVNIPGATVELSNQRGLEHELNVSWSGTNLISSGSTISVEYKDQGDNIGTGTGTVQQSSVSTPLAVTVTPYVSLLGGQRYAGESLIISGYGCSCEPLNINIQVNGNSQSIGDVHVETSAVWTDSKGFWSTQYEIRRLLEGASGEGTVTITVTYKDVKGGSATLSFNYDKYVAPAVVTSPVFRAMPYINGVAEKDTTVLMKYDGNQYQAKLDSHGRFVFDDVDLMMDGETFTITVIDIAGNESSKTYTIPSQGNNGQAVATGEIRPLGTIIFSGSENSSEAYIALPVSASELANGMLSVPLLFGDSYKIGNLTFTKTEDGVLVNSELNEYITGNDEYQITGDTFYVYTGKPGVDALREKTGQLYHYGEVVPVTSTDTFWIVDNRSLTMPASDVSGLGIYNYLYLGQEERAGNPEKYAEFEAYEDYQNK